MQPLTLNQIVVLIGLALALYAVGREFGWVDRDA